MFDDKILDIFFPLKEYDDSNKHLYFEAAKFTLFDYEISSILL